MYISLQKIVWLPTEEGMIQRRYDYVFVQFRLYR